MRSLIRKWMNLRTGSRPLGSVGALGVVACLALVCLGLLARGPEWGLSLGTSRGAIIAAGVRPNGLAWNQLVRPGQQIAAVEGRSPSQFLGRDLTGVDRISVVDSSGAVRQVEVPHFSAEIIVALVCGAFLFAGLGALVYRWASDDRVGLAFLAFGSSVAATLVSIPASVIGYGWAFAVSASSAIIASASFFALSVIFPRPLSYTKTAVLVVCTLSAILAISIGTFTLVGEPFPRLLDVLLWLWVIIASAGGMTILTLRARNPDDRRPLAPIIVGTGIGIAPLLVLDAIPFVIAHVMLVPATFTALGLVGIPLGFTYAILRHRLFALDALLRRIVLRVVEVATMVGVAGIFLSAFYTLGLGEPTGALLAVLVTALAAPTLVPPVRDLVDAVLYGSIFQARRHVRFGAETRPVHDLATALTREVRNLVPVRWVAFVSQPRLGIESTLDDEVTTSRPIAVDGDAPLERLHGRWIGGEQLLVEDSADATVVPVVSGQDVVGGLVVGPRLNNTPLNGLDLETIRLLAAQAAAPLEAAILREQAEEERRFREGLSSFARELAAAGSVEQVLQITVGTSARLLHADAGLVWLLPATGPPSLIGQTGDTGGAETAPLVPPSWPSSAPSVLRERYAADADQRTISRLGFCLGDPGSARALVELRRFCLDHAFSRGDERRAEEIAEHADGAFRRAVAMAQAAEAETLRQINQVRGEFLDIVTHDLQNPLSVIAGYAELLQMHLGKIEDPFVDNAILSIVQATQSCQRLIDDLLTSARLDRGHLTLNREPVDLGALVTRLAGGYQILPDGHRLVVEVHDPVTTSADVARLEQMIGNLVTNALRYAPEGAVILRVRRLGSTEAAIEVIDHGRGIAPDDQSRIWERFYRTASGTRKAPRGTGVGLWVVRILAELHGGRAEVESALGQGSLFRIVLPIAEPPDAPPASDSPDPAGADQPTEPRSTDPAPVRASSPRPTSLRRPLTLRPVAEGDV